MTREQEVKTMNRDDEDYGQFYVQNVIFRWRWNYSAAGIAVFLIPTLLFIKLSVVAIFLVIAPISIGIVYGPCTAEILYRKVKNYPKLYVEAGRYYTDMFIRTKWFRFQFFEPQLFWKTGLWWNSTSRIFILILPSLISWYFLVFYLNAFKFFFSGAAFFLLPYLTYSFHWLSALWWWKHKVVGPEKYNDLLVAR